MSLLTRTRNVEDFTAQACPYVTDKSIRSLVLNSPRLKRINMLYQDEMTNSSMVFIGRYCPTLLQLNISECPRITDAGLDYILRYCKNLTELSMSRLQFGTGFTITSALMPWLLKRTSLDHLGLAGCWIDTRQIQNLVKILNLKTVEIGFLQLESRLLKQMIQSCQFIAQEPIQGYIVSDETTLHVKTKSLNILIKCGEAENMKFMYPWSALLPWDKATKQQVKRLRKEQTYS